jgi:Meiotically up-regulated gene 113
MKMRLIAFGPRVFGLRLGASFGPEDFAPRRVRAASATVADNDPDDSFIYVLRGEHGLLKVGISNNPVARLASLRTASPFPLEMVYVAVTSGPANRLERATHDALAKSRCNGEWFDCPLSHAVAAINGSAYDLRQPIQAPPMNMSPETYVTEIFKKVARGHVPALGSPRGGILTTLATIFWMFVLIFILFVGFVTLVVLWPAHANTSNLTLGEGTEAQQFAGYCEDARINVEEHGNIGPAGRTYDACLAYVTSLARAHPDLCFSENTTTADLLDTAIEYISDSPSANNLHDSVNLALSRIYRCR